MDTITKETLDRYLSTSGLTDSQKTELRSEFDKTKGARSVLDKAVRLSGRKAMSKVPSRTSTK